MIDVEVLPLEFLAAVLAGVFITLEYILPCELNLFVRHTVKKAKQDYTWHADTYGNRAHHVLVLDGIRVVTPFAK